MVLKKFSKEKMIAKEKIKESKEENKQIFRASKPFPFSKSLCPGKTEIDVFSFGAPKNIEGKNWVKSWEIEKETIKIAKGIFEKNAKLIIKGKKLFAFIPGKNPVSIPKIVPKKIERISSIILFSHR